MTLIVDSIYNMVGKMMDLPEDENTPAKRVNKIFSKMDINKNDSLTLEEFKTGSMHDAWILEALAIDLPEAEHIEESSCNDDSHID